VDAKSPNENLNYALPIKLVLDAPSKADFDLRYSARLANARFSQVATLKAQFSLPKDFSDFATSYQGVMLDASRRDQAQLLSSFADQLFPKGNSAKLLATVFDTPLLGFVQQDDMDEWANQAADKVVDQDLPGGGVVTTGTSLGLTVFRLRRAAGASDDNFYAAPREFMDLLLKGLKLTRQVGDQSVRITSLGNPQSRSLFQDSFGRRWQVTRWPLGYADAYIVCYALPVPEGYSGFVSVVPSNGRRFSGAARCDRRFSTRSVFLRIAAGHCTINHPGSPCRYHRI
jgi:hypothetical protein